MGKVMNNNTFVDKLKYIASLPTVYYSVSGGAWAKWNGRSWNFDCVILVKAILWGWCENKNHSHGGANYGSNGVYDDGTEQLINRCSNISSDFNSITPGELVWLPGHVGVYIGNGKVIECTVDWSNCVQYSDIDRNGIRSKNGRVSLRWQKHGKLPYIEYVSSEKSKEKKTIDEIARDVINGYYGNYPERKIRLEAEGYIYREVQDRVNEILLGNNTRYLCNKNYFGPSIVDGLKGIGIDSSFSYRSKLAIANGIYNYVGSAEQNIKMLNMLKNGTLKSI